MTHLGWNKNVCSWCVKRPDSFEQAICAMLIISIPLSIYVKQGEEYVDLMNI
jgi:hypothetical protein